MQKKIYYQPVLSQILFQEADILTFSLNGTTQSDPFNGNPFMGNEFPTEVEEWEN